MKKFIAIILLLFVIMQEGRAQNPNLDYKYALKISNLSSYEEYNKIRNLSPSGSLLDFNTTNFQILQPTVAFQWKGAKNLFHEIELRSFSVSNRATSTVWRDDPSGNGVLAGEEKLTSTYISLQYETITNYFTSKERKFAPSLGASLNPYFRHNKTSTDIVSVNPVSEQYYGLRAFVTPRITYFINPKFFIDLNTPICVLDAYLVRDIVEHPTNPTATGQVSFYQFPKIFSARLGLGLKI